MGTLEWFVAGTLLGGLAFGSIAWLRGYATGVRWAKGQLDRFIAEQGNG